MSAKPAAAAAGQPARPPPPPVIPSSWLAPHEQRWLFVTTFGLIEIIKVWDVLVPYFIPNPEPTWSSAIRLRGPVTALLWTAAESATIFLVSLLRIPMLSPSKPQLVKLLFLFAALNLACWIVAHPSSLWLRLNLFGPPALGMQWYLAWWPAVRSLVWKEPHIAGVHHIRLLPYSTATLNPLSMTYCLPPDSPGPLYIPVLFNNSVPEQVSYFLRALDTGHTETKVVSGSSMRRSLAHKPRLAITDNDTDEEDTSEPEIDPLSAMVLHSSPEVDTAKLPSVKPADSLALVPRDLEASQQLLFLQVDRPCAISLKSVVDKGGDRFHIIPNRDAVVVECPSGGHFAETPRDKKQPAELRCVGDEEVARFEARGVGSLKIGWRKKCKDSTQSGLIEGIEDEVEPVDQLALVRRDKVSKTHVVPLRVIHDKAGVYTVSLTSVTDSLHNTYTPTGHSAEKVYNVFTRPSAQFVSTSPVRLLKDGTASLDIQLDGSGPLASPIEISYLAKTASGAKTKTIIMRSRSGSIPVSEPGTYVLLDIAGTCAGSILEPSSCVVQLVTPPSVEMTVTTLHECAMDVGVTASFDFIGTPPFTVEYTEQRKGSRAASRSKRFDSHHGEIELLPDQEGQYIYNFNTLSDRQYSRIKLDKPAIQQTVHPLANVELIGVRRQQLYACSGDEVEVEMEVKGAKPLQLTYLKSWSSHAQNVTVMIPAGKSKVAVPVPPDFASDSGASGQLAISLLSVVDGNGCERKLPAPTVQIDIDRQRPTARFARSERVVVIKGDVARAQLRLTGTGPWDVSYSLDGKERTATMRDPNSHLSFDGKGVYRLTKVKDAHCPGEIVPDAATFEVDFKSRPGVTLVQSPSVSQDGTVARHKGLCAEEEDQVALRFDGQAPFELGYRHTREGHTAKHILKSAQDTGILHLDTEPGYHRYDFFDLRDSNYPQTEVSFALEHEVYSRPSASFIRQNSKPLCLDSSLQGDARVRLLGKAPFELTLAVRKPGSIRVKEYTVTSEANEWTIDLPYVAAEIGRHEVTIASVADAGGCAWVVHEQDRLSTIVEVVESARIVPVSPVEDLCVGDRLDFLLQGKAPWTIEYEWLGKKNRDSSAETRFSRVADRAGIFEIKSVALKDNQCKREITDLVRRVHPLPSVRIQEGLDNLREGDEPAAFSVSFTGAAPFTFTYTRSETVGSKMRVVDTQTVTDIWEKEYTISSSLPGDYEVTSVADRWCRYPPIRKKGD